MKANEEEILRAAIKILKKKKISMPSTVMVLANLIQIKLDIENGIDVKTIVNMYEIGINPISFSCTFKRATGVSMTEIVRKSAFERRLVRKGFKPEVIKEIMECNKPIKNEVNNE